MPPPKPKLYAHARETQFIMVLLAALVDLSDKVPTKREVEKHIEKRGYLKLPEELLKKAFDSKAEEEWKTLLAFARARAIKGEWLKPLSRRDAWEISERGEKFFARLEQRFRAGEFADKQFEFLSDKFLERMGAKEP
jgi:hypothetical protein